MPNANAKKNENDAKKKKLSEKKNTKKKWLNSKPSKLSSPSNTKSKNENCDK